jgi:hypothetical protein
MLYKKADMKKAEVYLQFTDTPRIQMSGKGAPKSTVYGALGQVQGSDGLGVKTLGGLVRDTKTGMHLGPGVYVPSKDARQTEHMILGKPAKTDIPGHHFGQVPYAGQYMSKLGSRL